jgi:integrase
LPPVSFSAVARMVAGMQGKITKRVVDTLEAGVLWDSDVRGFGIRARPGGKVYVLKFRTGGKQRWYTIGRHGSPWTPETARREAKRLLGDLAAGRAPGQPRGGITVGKAIEAYVEARCRYLRSGKQLANVLRMHVATRWGGRKIASIARSDVVALLGDVQGGDRTKRIAIVNKVRMVLSRFFRWAIAEALVETNPVAGTERRLGEEPRRRVLTDAEIASVWNAANGWPSGAIIRLLLATGQRRGEVGGMRWSEIEGEIWTIPAERSKNKRGHTVPLNVLAMGLLAKCPRIEGHDAIFSVRAGFSDWSAAKRRLDTRCGLRDWRLHDLRRTVATGMQAAGVLPHTVAAVLNHSTAGLFGVTAIYLRDRQEEAKRAAMSVWDRRLRDILETPT